MSLFGGLINKIKNIKNKWSQKVSNLFSDSPLTPQFWDELEECLIAGDVGIEETEIMIDELKQISIDKVIAHTEELRGEFARLLIERLEAVPGMGEPIDTSSRPTVIMLVGVNGSGKTTTAGKLASMYLAEGRKVILAAADTYRAAAIEQIKTWGERAGVRVISSEHGSDSAAVVFDAVQAAKASNADIVIADTAGRLQTKSNLMDELAKVGRAVGRSLDGGRAETLLVLDSVMGQNGLMQAEAFNKAIPLTGVIMTKFDNTAKGGIAIAIVKKLSLPIRYIGLGEGMDDIEKFDPTSYVRALLGMEANDEVA